MKPNSSIDSSAYPTCKSCVFFDPSYQSEGPNYGLCRQSRNVQRDDRNGPPMDLHPITGKDDQSCTHFNDGKQPSIFVAPDDQMIGKMLSASKILSEKIDPMYLSKY